MSCIVSQGVVMCQLGYLGGLFMAATFAFIFTALYRAGYRRGVKRQRARNIGKDL